LLNERGPEVITQVPSFDEERAAALVGKSVLVGVTYFNSDGAELRRVQLHGIVASASAKGIMLSLRGKRRGETFTLPPDLDAITNAAPGTYRLRETGETVVDPDLLITWGVWPPVDRTHRT
jgi:hypothetical protein